MTMSRHHAAILTDLLLEIETVMHAGDLRSTTLRLLGEDSELGQIDGQYVIATCLALTRGQDYLHCRGGVRTLVEDVEYVELS